MREPYGKAVATRAGPEPWRFVRKDGLQASVGGVRAGHSAAKHFRPGRRGDSPTPKTVPAVSLARDAAGPCAVVDPTHVRRLSTQELGGPAFGRDGDGVAVRAVNLKGARRR